MHVTALLLKFELQLLPRVTAFQHPAAPVFFRSTTSHEILTGFVDRFIEGLKVAGPIIWTNDYWLKTE